MDILGNQIGEEQANNLIQILDASDTLTTLCGFTGTETELDLSGRNLSAPCAILMAIEVKFNSAMMKLKIHKHELPIQEIKTATELDLSNKELNNLDAIVIAALLPLNE